MNADNTDVEVAAASVVNRNLNFRVYKNGSTDELRVRTSDSFGRYYTTVVNKLTVKAEDGTTTTYDVKLNMLPAETGAQLETVTVNGKEATINHSAKTVTVALNYGTNLGNVELELTASKLANVQVGSANYTGAMDLSLVNPVKITVTAENGKDKNVYTLTATVGDMFRWPTTSGTTTTCWRPLSWASSRATPTGPSSPTTRSPAPTSP